MFQRWYVNEFLFRWRLGYFLYRISLVFVVFLHFFTVFCVFSLPFLSFVESFNRIRTQRKQLRVLFFNFIVLLCPFFICFQSVLFPSFSRRLFSALYHNLCIKSTLNLVTLVSQETGDKLWCYNARSVTNHIANFALLIIYIRCASQSTLFSYAYAQICKQGEFKMLNF